MIFLTKVVEKIKKLLACAIIFPPRNRALYEIMLKKYGRARQATYENIIQHMGFAYWINEARIQPHTRNI